MRPIFFCIPSFACMLAWSIWGLFQLCPPRGVLGWVAMSLALVAVVIFLVLLHSVVVQLLVPDVGAEDADS